MAVVGESGSGKSTVMALLERSFDGNFGRNSERRSWGFPMRARIGGVVILKLMS